MDKKELAAIVQSIVEDCAKHHGMPEGSARAFVGLSLHRHKAAFVQAIVLPSLQLVSQQETATPEQQPEQTAEQTS